jgi:hypothetical protein
MVERVKDVAFDLHRHVGSGYRESTYQALFAHKPVGILVNFNAPRMKDGWHRAVHPTLLRRDSGLRDSGCSPPEAASDEEEEP